MRSNSTKGEHTSCMFYEREEPTDRLFRFGDVVRGFACCTPILKKPLLDTTSSLYQIEVCTSHFSAILSPCCSIDNEILLLAPLQALLPSFFQNPWLVGDFTRVNRKMPAEKSVPPHKWQSIPQDVKEREFDLENDAYAFDDFFVYKEHPLLPRYTVNMPNGPNQETGYYIVDFKTAYRTNCDQIRRNKPHPIEAKLLQLSKESRSDLREKIVAYFARVPFEDRI